MCGFLLYEPLGANLAHKFTHRRKFDQKSIKVPTQMRQHETHGARNAEQMRQHEMPSWLPSKIHDFKFIIIYKNSQIATIFTLRNLASVSKIHAKFKAKLKLKSKIHAKFKAKLKSKIHAKFKIKLNSNPKLS